MVGKEKKIIAEIIHEFKSLVEMRLGKENPLTLCRFAKEEKEKKNFP